MTDTAQEHSDIQGLLRGFGLAWPWACFALLELGDDARANQRFLAGLGDESVLGTVHTSGPISVENLRRFREDQSLDCGYNVAFTAPALERLDVRRNLQEGFPDDFREGMACRADINGDDRESAPACWEAHWRDRCVHVWLGIYCRSEQLRVERIAALDRYLAAGDFPGVTIRFRDLAHRFVSDDTPLWIDDAASKPEPGQVMEHFGFHDGISNPAIKGLTDRPQYVRGGGRIDEDGVWQPLAAGEFLYGYIDQIGEIAPGPPTWGLTNNGTYLVYRKLSQDVDGFREYVTAKSRHYPGLGPDDLAAKMVGRRRNGETLLDDAPTGDAMNDFDYASDPRGFRCPLGAHARRANPRDTLGFRSLLVDRHRILRRAMPYGDPVPTGEAQAARNDVEHVECDGRTTVMPGQGLIFIALNIDIVRQFEFVQSQWLNFGNDLDQGTARDPIVGNHDGTGRMSFPTEDQGLHVCPGLPRFVATRGGDYFFLPGVRAFRGIVGGEFA